MICQACGVAAETKYVSFHQNIGALIIRFPKSISGNLCKRCIHKHFWSMTPTTMFLGWWGTISLIITPFLLINNIGRYVVCLGMPPVPADATPPELTEQDIQQIMPHSDQLFERINSDDEKFEAVIRDTAMLAGVSPGQILLFIRVVTQNQLQK